MQNQIRQNIINLAKQKGMPINQLERDAGLHKNFIANFLYVKSRYPRLDSIAKIAEVLQVGIDELVGRGGYNKTPDLVVARFDILTDVLSYMSTALKEKKNSQLKLEKILKAVHEIYAFSLKKDSFDKEFADWFINCQL